MSGETLRAALALSLSICVLHGCGGDPEPAVDGGRDAGACTDDSTCDDGDFCNGAETCAAGSCVEGTTPCMASQICDEATETCTTECAVDSDADGDGVDAMACGGDDCDDADPDAFPGNAELCDLAQHDEDCDPATLGERDVDGDGLDDAACCNGSQCGADCNDLARAVSPDSPEVCNGLDDDCDGAIDEGGVQVPSWPDLDFDLHGDADATPAMRCAGAHGFATVGDDCDDARPSVHPAQVEICDTIDNDCDGTVDEAPAATTWYLDGDDDGFGDPDPAGARVSCTPLPGFSLRPTDCDDSARGISPAATEQCNGIDDDCDGAADYEISPGNFEDDDLDRHADAMCPSGTDCDDRDPTTRTGAVELCDRRDNDCDGTIDEESAMGIWYRDSDGDTFGDDGMPTVMSCTFVVGHIPRGGDCDDSDPLRRPSVAEACNGVDDDCDADIDEGADRAAYYADVDLDGLGAGVPVLACAMPTGRVAIPGDCDDAAPSIGGPSAWYPDRDGDGSGDAAVAATLACEAPLVHVASSDDCDDGDALVEPGAPERCNAVDDDCDGTADDGASATCAFPNASASCTAGACVIDACDAGYDDCDAMSATGCELSTLTDRLHCGGCGMVCAPGDACRAGECVRVTAIEGGQSHFCALLSSGEVWCWGYNQQGQIGNGTTGTSSPPRRVQHYTSVPLDAIAIASHPSAVFNCAIQRGGQVVCWGNNDSGQLGPDGGARATRATPVPGLTDAIEIAVGAGHACAILAGGGVRCWGDNLRGQLAMGTASSTDLPEPQVVLEREGATTRPVADGQALLLAAETTCIVHAGGTRISCAGLNSSGQLGRSTNPAGSVDPYADDVDLLPAGTVVRDGDAGYAHFCIRRESGRALCWGSGANGQLGAGYTGGSRATPAPVDLILADDRMITLGHQFTCIRYLNPIEGERLACFGYDGGGVLGDGAPAGSSTAADAVADDVLASPPAAPTEFLPGGPIGAGYSTTCAVTVAGSIVCWGSNGYDSFGSGESGVSSRAYAAEDHPVLGVP